MNKWNTDFPPGYLVYLNAVKCWTVQYLYTFFMFLSSFACLWIQRHSEEWWRIRCSRSAICTVSLILDNQSKLGRACTGEVLSVMQYSTLKQNYMWTKARRTVLFSSKDWVNIASELQISRTVHTYIEILFKCRLQYSGCYWYIMH